MSTETAPDDAGQAVAIVTEDPTTTALAVRAQTEIQAAITVAKRFPRDVTAAYRDLMAATKRPTFAKKGRYSFPRGGQEVAGPSVNLAREAARCWGNIRFGVNIIPTEDSEEMIHIEAWAHDAQTNTWAYAQDLFPNRVQRRGKGWIKPDERDRRELVNRRGALNVRNALLQLLPSDIIEDAVNACKSTTLKAATNSLEANREDTIRKLVLKFEKYGVSIKMLERRLGHGLDIIDAAELDELLTIGLSIMEGNSPREDHFDVPAAQAEGVADLNSMVQDGLAAEVKPEPLCAVPDCGQPKSAHASNKLKHSFAAPDLWSEKEGE